MKPSLGEFIRKRREELGLTQRDLALHVGFKSLAHLSDIESGKRNPGQEHMEKIAEKLEVCLQELESHDVRVSIQEAKELFEDRPDLVPVFRRVLETARNVSADELLRRLDGHSSRPRLE